MIQLGWVICWNRYFHSSLNIWTLIHNYYTIIEQIQIESIIARGSFMIIKIYISKKVAGTPCQNHIDKVVITRVSKTDQLFSSLLEIFLSFQHHNYIKAQRVFECKCFQSMFQHTRHQSYKFQWKCWNFNWPLLYCISVRVVFVLWWGKKRIKLMPFIINQKSCQNRLLFHNCKHTFSHVKFSLKKEYGNS